MSAASSLPVIDISPFLSPDAGEDSVGRLACAEALHKACAEVGFFYLTGHGIPESLTHDVLELSRRFFKEASPSEKQAIARRDPGDGYGDGARGYQKVGENVTGGRRDFHEAIDLFAEPGNLVPGESCGPYKLLQGRNLWPDEPEELKPTCEDYIERVKEVGTAVVRAMGWALSCAGQSGSDKEAFVNATRHSFWVMRLIGYPPLPATNGKHDDADASGVSCGEHTDYGCVTLLLADSTRGALQVQRGDGAWIEVDPLQGAFVVNIGDMMERWTNGVWKSTKHRVIHRSDSYRVSAPFFFEPDFDAVVRPMESCVLMTGGKTLYEPVIYGEHLVAKVSSNFA